MIAPARGGEAAGAGRSGTAVLGDPVAEARGRPQEPPGRRAFAMLLVAPDAVDQKAHSHILACVATAYLTMRMGTFIPSAAVAEGLPYRRAMDLPLVKC